MSITMLPINLTGDNNTTGSAVGTTPPRRMQRDLRVVEVVWTFNLQATLRKHWHIMSGH